jgi:hypothetical protein
VVCELSSDESSADKELSSSEAFSTLLLFFLTFWFGVAVAIGVDELFTLFVGTVFGVAIKGAGLREFVGCETEGVFETPFLLSKASFIPPTIPQNTHDAINEPRTIKGTKSLLLILGGLGAIEEVN